MYRILISVISALITMGAFAAELPQSIFVGEREQGHVQGIAVDREKGFLYLSFTTQFLKTDLKGNIVGSIDRIQGHLGAMTLGPDGRVYASLECKDDVIGSSIARYLGTEKLSHDSSRFYVAIIDVDKVSRTGMDPEKDAVMTTVCVNDAVRDYQSGDYGCSGIDGITFAPAFGRKGGRQYLYVAYGIYGDINRKDNDNQVLLCYDTSGWKRYETAVTFGELHENGPQKALRKYFIHTGNTEWGVQNLAYDSSTNQMFLAVYKGSKSRWPNYDVFALDMNQQASSAPLEGVPYSNSPVEQLEVSGAWYFRWGSTGLCPLGDGSYYISHNGASDGNNYCEACLYRWHASSSPDISPFVPATDAPTGAE